MRVFSRLSQDFRVALSNVQRRRIKTVKQNVKDVSGGAITLIESASRINGVANYSSP
jgi:hypothetical protein